MEYLKRTPGEHSEPALCYKFPYEQSLKRKLLHLFFFNINVHFDELQLKLQRRLQRRLQLKLRRRLQLKLWWRLQLKLWRRLQQLKLWRRLRRSLYLEFYQHYLFLWSHANTAVQSTDVWLWAVQSTDVRLRAVQLGRFWLQQLRSA
jgi:hypothetical protein